MTFVLFIEKSTCAIEYVKLKKRKTLVILLLQILKTLETAEKNVDMRCIYLSKAMAEL